MSSLTSLNRIKSDSSTMILVLKKETEIPESFKVNVFKFLHTCFCLPEEQVPQEAIELIFNAGGGSNPSLEELRQVFADSRFQINQLLSKGIQNHLSSQNSISLSCEELNEVTADLRTQVVESDSFDEMSIPRFLKNHPLVRTTLSSVLVGNNLESFRSSRSLAAKNMNSEFSDVVSRWRANPIALSDEVMSKCFVRNDNLVKTSDDLLNHFLTTYFDTAQFGLTCKPLTEQIENYSRQKGDFPEYQATLKEGIFQYFNSRQCTDLFSFFKNIKKSPLFSDLHRGLQITENGTNAFRQFIDLYGKEEDVFLIGPHEYSSVVQQLPQKEGQILRLPDSFYGNDFASNERLIRDILICRKVNYVLLSELSRHGDISPLSDLRKLLDQYSPETDLIVDAVQSVGRRTIDFDSIRPSVLFGSIQKGSNIDGTLGFLMLSDDFLGKGMVNAVSVNEGSVDPRLLVRLFAACQPDQLEKFSSLESDISSADLKKINMKVSKREKAIQQLTTKFFELLSEVNRRCNNRIKILSPKNIYDPDGRVNESALSPITTLKIEGLNCHQIQGTLESYGISINSCDDELDPGNSFRIAFHPFMGNDSIKILCHALYECASAA